MHITVLMVMLCLGLQHPLSWQPSADGTRMIGHMILKKTVREGVGPTSSAAILGLKVVGGKLLENGGRGAVIEKVKKGSTADVEGQLRPGDFCWLIDEPVQGIKLKS